MIEVHLIRHGKASPRGEDYDVLSDKGIRQARTTGAWLAANATRFDLTFVGPLQRQKDTWHHVCESGAEVAAQWPAPRVVEGLAEAPLVALLRQVLPRRLPTDGELQQLVRALEACTDKTERKDRYSQIYRHIVRLWFDDQLQDADVERYGDFCARVSDVWSTIRAAAETLQRGHGRVVLVSSMGTISELLKQALGWDREQMLVQSEAIANASITTLALDGDRFSLQRFNAIHHLEPDGLVTYI